MQVFSSGVDRVCVMNFVDSYSLQIARITDMVTLAKQYNKPLCAAVETQNLSYSPVSFFEEGSQYLQNTLVQADQTPHQMAPSQWTNYFIHDYAALLELPSSPSNYQYVSNRINVCIYVWQWWLAWANYTTDRQQMWTFLAAQPYTVTHILFESEALLYSDQASLQAFIEEAATKGYQVEMAVGFAKWALAPYHYYVVTLMQIAANFIRLGPIPDPYNPPADGSPSLPTNSPAPTVYKTDVPWPTDAFSPPTPSPSAAGPTATGTTTAAPSSTATGTTPAATAAPTGTAGGRVPGLQSSATGAHSPVAVLLATIATIAVLAAVVVAQ